MLHSSSLGLTHVHKWHFLPSEQPLPIYSSHQHLVTTILLCFYKFYYFRYLTCSLCLMWLFSLPEMPHALLSNGKLSFFKVQIICHLNFVVLHDHLHPFHSPLNSCAPTYLYLTFNYIIKGLRQLLVYLKQQQQQKILLFYS